MSESMRGVYKSKIIDAISKEVLIDKIVLF